MELDNTNNLDIGDYMDIVTTYKCRFCSFTCAEPQGISNHVKQVHIQQTAPKQKETIQINDKQVPIDSTLTVDMATGCVQIQPLSEDNNEVKVITEQECISNFNCMLENLDNLQSGGTTENTTTDTLVPQANVTVVSVDTLSGEQQIVNFTNEIDQDNSPSSNKVISIQPLSSQDGVEKEIHVYPDQDSTESHGDIADGSTQTTGNKQAGVTLEIQPYQSVSSPKNMPPITKELFLCGQCSIGYNSIEDCKTHMIEDHNFQIDDPCDSNIKISVGTQVEKSGKKPGRKKKSETIENESAEDTVKIQPLSDSDWEEDKEEYYIGSRSRRKIRRPKALKDDFYLPKRIKTESKSDTVMNSSGSSKQKQQTLVNDKGEEKCHVVGCYAKFKSKESLDIHVKCHIENDTSFLCPDCSQKFANWKVLRTHLWKCHKIDTDLLECETCHDYKTDTVSKLLIHKEIHSYERPYTCDVCGKGFRQYSQMKNHQIVHNVDDGDASTKRKSQCDICKRTFTNHKCLMKHIEGVHSQVKPYECLYCGYATTRKAMLQLHVRTHTKEKPFKCDVCSFATGDHNSLRRHTMRHTGQRPYRCNYCSYTCIQAISIKMHMKNKHPGSVGIFCCNECTYRTVNEHFFKNHLEDHKNGLITEKEQNVGNIQKTVHIMTSDNGMHMQEIIGMQGKPGEVVQDSLPVDLQMQVQTLDSGETQISADDFARLSSLEELGTSSITSGQLITCALNAIAQNSGMVNTVQIVNGIQISVNSAEPKDGVTNHTITFHVPGPENFQNDGSQVILEQVDEITEIPVQGLSFDDVTESEGISQSTNNDQQVYMTPQGEIINLVSSATIDDLAQISCIVKDGVTFENNLTE